MGEWGTSNVLSLYVEFSTHNLIQYLPKVKIPFVDNSRAEPTTFSTEEMSFSLKLLSGNFKDNLVLRLFKVFGFLECPLFNRSQQVQ